MAEKSQASRAPSRKRSGARQPGRAAALGVALLLALTPGAAQARVPTDPAALRALRTSDSLFRVGRFDSAAAMCTALEQVTRATHDRNTLLECRLRQAAAWVSADRVVPGELAAREGLALARALDDSSNVRRALRWIGYSYLKRTRLEAAAPYYQELLALSTPVRDYESQGFALGSLAYRDLLAGRLQDAERGYRMACACFDSTHDTRGKMWNLVGLARVQADLGDFAGARASYMAITRTATASGAASSEADALNNLGTLEYGLGDPALAESYWRRAVAIYRRVGDEAPMLSTEINLCIAAIDLGRTGEAARRLDSLATLSTAKGFRAQEASALNQLAELRLTQGRPLEAATIFRRVLRAVRPEETGRVSLASRGLARALAASGHPDQALAELRDGAERLRTRLAASERLALDIQLGRLELACGHPARARDRLARAGKDSEREGLPLRRLDALVGEAECERELRHAAVAMKLLFEAQGLWEGERRIPSDPEWRVQRGQLAEALCFALGELVLADSARGGTARVRDAYDLLQRFKARTLLERMAGPAGALPTGPAGTPVTLAQVQSRVLHPGELLLDAFLGDHDALLFAVTRDTLRMLRLPDAAVLDERVRILRELDAASEAHPPGGLTAAVRRRAARQLASDLLGGVTDLLARSLRVVISADGALIGLPFESLPVKLAPGTAEQELVALREVTRVPSVSLLSALRARRPSTAAFGLLASATNDRGRPLPAALAEARWLSRRYAGAEARIGGTGGGPLSAAELARYDVLHFAAHARVDDQGPWNSAVLVDVSDSSGASGCLTASGIAATRLGARLAVLAGCESAGGRVVWGEGVEGLTAAFLVAGVPAVVATLWPVDDAASSRFTHAFYGRLEDGEDVAAALRAARSALASASRTDDAAAFVLIGDGDVRVALRRRFPVLPAALALVAIGAVAAGLVRWVRGPSAGPRAQTL